MTHHIYWKTPFEKTIDYARAKHLDNQITVETLKTKDPYLYELHNKY